MPPPGRKLRPWRTPVLHAVSLVVPAAQVTVLTGPSGAGKTTIADLILGLHQPDAGQVLLDGVPLREIDLASWRSLVGYVPQELVLFHDTIFANVALGDPRIGEAEAQHALEVAGAWDFVRKLPEGMSTHVGESGAKLSGGERQRIALARALVSRPRLLILDEVTSALDPDTEWQICRGIRALAGEMAVLAITHRPAFLEIADRVLSDRGWQRDRGARCAAGRDAGSARRGANVAIMRCASCAHWDLLASVADVL